MHIVYVKHYLTKEGIHFFHTAWFPKVLAIMCQQPGYLALEHIKRQDSEDCINIAVKFINEATLLEWCNHPEHDELIHALDDYRSRAYWEFAINAQDNSSLSWEKVTKLASS